MNRTNDYLSLRNLAKSYDGHQIAVENVSLSVNRGEFVSFLGPSGSGKTTTLMMIAGFENPSAGQIHLNGRELGTLPPHRRDIGMVFQNYALFPHLTMQRNVEFPLKMRGVAPAERAARAAEALALVGLDRFRTRRPRELSGGQQQRAALARALVFQPDVLLLDEPLGALDKNLREQMQIEIKRIQQSLGITTIYVTHDQSEAMNMSDRIVVFRNGGIEQVGPPLEIYRKPATAFVASFLGDCNLLDGVVVDGRAGVVDVAAVGRLPLEPARGMADGKHVQVMLRPECARPSDDACQPDLCSFDVSVNDLSHFGDTALLTGTLATRSFRIRMLGSEVPQYAPGQSLRVTARLADFWIIPDQDACAR